MDSTEPPRIVFQVPAECRDGDGADAALRAGLANARAPSSGWTLTLHVERAGRSEGHAAQLRVTGDLNDASGAQVAHRQLTEATSECSGLTRAIGVWAGLVLESEVQKAAALTSGPVPSIAAEAAAPATTGWPAPATPDPPSPEHDWYLHHDEDRSLEIGAGVFLMSGSGGGALTGPVAFMMIESGHGIFLRPSIAVGQTVTAFPPTDVHSATFGAARFDACLRLPGLYSKHHGMQLDLCGGSDVGITHIDSLAATNIPYVGIGPSLDLRGELGGRLSAVLRAVVAVDVWGGSYVDLSGDTEQAPLATARLELAFSWDVL